jgi:hypothetical protein
MRIGGEIWTSNPCISGQPPAGGWELESAQFAAARAGRELARLRALNPDAPALDRAERRYRRALQLLQRIRTSLNDSSTAD